MDQSLSKWLYLTVRSSSLLPSGPAYPVSARLRQTFPFEGRIQMFAGQIWSVVAMQNTCNRTFKYPSEQRKQKITSVVTNIHNLSNNNSSNSSNNSSNYSSNNPSKNKDSSWKTFKSVSFDFKYIFSKQCNP